MYPVGSVFNQDQKMIPKFSEKPKSSISQVFKNSIADSKEYERQLNNAKQGLPTDFSAIKFRL